MSSSSGRVSVLSGGAASSPWDGLIVLCAANSYDAVKMADRHVAEHLSRLVPVLYVDPPRSVLKPGRPRLRLEAPGLARLTPVVQPYPSRRGTACLTTIVTCGYLRMAVARLGGSSRALVSGWPQFPVFGSCREQVRLYWARDDFVGGADLLGLNARLIDARERRIAASADIVVAASPVVARTWRERGLDPVLIPYGTDVAAYRDVERAPAVPEVRLPGPVAGFVGRINDRTDLSLLEAVAERGRSLLLVGPRDHDFGAHRFAALCQRRNVHWAGPQPSAALPGYLRLIDVGLVPYRDTAFNRGSFPLKTLEYLAAGRGVVATDLPSIRWLDTQLISIVTGPAAFADAVDRLLAQPRTPDLAARRQAFAEPHSWARRADQLYQAITGATAS